MSHVSEPQDKGGKIRAFKKRAGEERAGDYCSLKAITIKKSEWMEGGRGALAPRGDEITQSEAERGQAGRPRS